MSEKQPVFTHPLAIKIEAFRRGGGSDPIDFVVEWLASNSVSDTQRAIDQLIGGYVAAGLSTAPIMVHLIGIVARARERRRSQTPKRSKHR